MSSFLTYQGKYLTFNGKYLTTPEEPAPPPDSVSLNPTSYNFGLAGGSTTNVTTVTSSIAGTPSGWTAQITSDPNNIIASLDVALGDSGQSVWMTCITNSTQHTTCAFATITVTCGDATEDLTISQDGTVETCS